MRLAAIALVFATTTGASAQTASPECLVIDGLDTLYAVQLRLSRNPDTVLFTSDIRILRGQISKISERAALEAIESNVLTIKGNTFVRFLRNTQALLQKVSFDDPNSIARHFSRDVRSNLSNVGEYLLELRCSEEQIRTASRNVLQANRNADGDGDEEDDAAEILRNAAKEVFNLTNLFLMMAITITAVIGTKVIRNLLLRQKRRAKRHATVYPADYRINQKSNAGVLLDINCFGTKLRHAKNGVVEPGTSIELFICGEWTGGSAAWSNAHYVGIQFDRPISLKAVEEICQIPKVKSKKQNGAQMDAA